MNQTQYIIFYFCLFILFLVLFIISLILIIKKKNKRKNFLLDLGKKQIPKEEDIVYVLELHPFFIISFAFFISMGICCFICFLSFKCLFLFFDEDISQNVMASCIFLSLICPFALFFLPDMLDILLVTNNGLYPVHKHDSNIPDVIKSPIYYEEIKDIYYTSCTTRSGPQADIILYNSEKTINIAGLYFPRKLKKFINNKIGRISKSDL